MIDTPTVVKGLERRGHTVSQVIPVPENAGDWEFIVDGNVLSLAEARALMEADDEHAKEVPAQKIIDEQERIGA